MKKKLKFFLKLIFGIGILIFLFSKTSRQEFIHMLVNADYKFFIFSLFLYIIGQVVSARKWMILSQRLNFNNKFILYLRLYFLGMFYNMFLPTNIGGDIIKVIKLKNNEPLSTTKAIISVISDRITGVCVLVLFIILGSIFYHNLFWINIFNLCLILGSFIGIIIFIFVTKNKKLIPEKFIHIFESVLLLCEKKCIFKITFLSLFFHLLLIIIHYFIALMYNLNIPISYYLLLYPITAIVASLPISINGIGCKELVYVYMLKPFNIDTSSAVLFVMTFNMITFFASTLGFIPYISKDKNN